MLELGRFVPRALSAAGYFDGAYVDVPVGNRLRLGGAAGFRPTREDLTPSADEPTGLAFASFTSSEADDARVRYTGTLGVLGSAYDGHVDRLAVLTEQFLDAGDLRASATAEIDFDVGGQAFRNGTRLTRLDAYASWTINDPITVRAGVDHYERLDTRAERHTIGFVDAALYRNDFWRYWGGARLSITNRFHFDVELGAIEGGRGYDTTNWRTSLTHFDAFGISGSSASLTVYNLEGLEGDGVGGLLTGHFPLAGSMLFLRPGLGFRSFQLSREDFEVTDAHLHVDHFLSEKWELHAGVTYLTGASLDTVLIEIGAAFRW